MTATYWFVVAGILLSSIALTSTLLRRLPVSASVIYLGIGIILGPGVLGLISWDAVQEAHVLERFTEIAVIVALFTVGLNLRHPLRDPIWFLPLRLATVTMVLTIGAVALIGTILLGLPLGAAVLLGAC